MALNDDQEKELKSGHEKALKEANDKFAAEKAEWEKSKPPPAKVDDPADLAKKAALQREEDEKRQGNEKRLESSINFLVGSKDWAKTNSTLLPKTIDGILEQAEKENYGSKVEKSNAIKVGIISEFFAVQANLDQLTGTQKVALEQFKALTKDKKQDQAEQIWDSIFEPTFETMKKVKRAELVSKGFKDESSGEQAYADRRIKNARKQHLGEK